MSDYNYKFNDRRVDIVFCHLKQDRELFDKIIRRENFRSETWCNIINSSKFPLVPGSEKAIIFNIEYPDGKYIQEFFDFIDGNGWKITTIEDSGINRVVYVKKL